MPRVYRDARAMHIKLPAANRYNVNFRVVAKSARTRVVPTSRRVKNDKERERQRERTNRRRRGAWNDLWAASWTLDTRMSQNLVVEDISLVASSPPCEENATRRTSGPTCTSRRPRWEDGYPCVSPMTPGKKGRITSRDVHSGCPAAICAAHAAESAGSIEGLRYNLSEFRYRGRVEMISDNG